MSDELIVYVKNDAQKNQLQKKYPSLKDDQFFNMAGVEKGLVDDLVPMVCITKEGQEQRCETGEEYINIFLKETK